MALRAGRDDLIEDAQGQLAEQNGVASTGRTGWSSGWRVEVRPRPSHAEHKTRYGWHFPSATLQVSAPGHSEVHAVGRQSLSRVHGKAHACADGPKPTGGLVSNNWQT
jgi:hypothetical protein